MKEWTCLFTDYVLFWVGRNPPNWRRRQSQAQPSVWDIHQWVNICYTGCHDSIELLESWLYPSLQVTSSASPNTSFQLVRTNSYTSCRSEMLFIWYCVRHCGVRVWSKLHAFLYIHRAEKDAKLWHWEISEQQHPSGKGHTWGCTACSRWHAWDLSLACFKEFLPTILELCSKSDYVQLIPMTTTTTMPSLYQTRVAMK